MEASTPAAEKDAVDSHFVDAADEFPFYDCISKAEPHHQDAVQSDADKLRKSLSGPRRRRRISGIDSGNSNPGSSVSFGSIDTSASTSYADRTLKFRRNSQENAKENVYSNDLNPSSSVGFDSFDASNATASCTATTLESGCNSKENVKESENIIVDLTDSNPSSSLIASYSDMKNDFLCNAKKNVKESENSAVDLNILNPSASVITPYNDKKDKFLRNLKEDVKESESSTFTTADDEAKDNVITVDSRSNIVNEASFLNVILVLAGLVIKATEFQIHLLVKFFTFPIWLMYNTYMFVVDPIGVARRGRQYLMRILLRIWGGVCEVITPFMYEWLKEHRSIWMLALRLGWGLVWSFYVCFILVSLLLSAVLFSGFVIRVVVEEPIRMKETLNFDYTKNTPVAFVPVISCPALSCGVNSREECDAGKVGGQRVIPLNHKLQVTVSLTLPESDYNRNLGIFQVRVDLLSVHGKALASSRHPCMLQFRSQPIRYIMTFFKVAPIIAGYYSESQNLELTFRGFTEGNMPTACLRVIIKQRAEFRPGAGIPEIYAATLSLESELPLFKRILWDWKKTIFVWMSMLMFTVELLFTLICCKPFIIPRIRLRSGSANSTAPQNNRSV
ncbi:hypothetical protein RJ639_018464 [Escallonia herrerae]|uniref:Seipin n=1 Tax=Escallonia herrerae TaxID=1293975 RepID=A0AA89AJJ0_9ASTE|nr:hypothetical protein RJ639_018464 [Escallonia herrerae]